MRTKPASTSRLLIVLVALYASASVNKGQEPAPQPIFRGGVSAVNVDVVVSDRSGQPVADLTQDDFEVLENGKRQEIEQFRLVRVDGRATPGAPEPREIRSLGDEEVELEREDVRVFVIFLDDYHVTRAMSMRVRQRLIPFVKSQFGPNDLVAIMTPLTPVGALTFTRSQDFIVNALGRFEGRADDLSPRNPVEAGYAFRPPAEVRAIRRQVALSALQGLAVRLGSVREGRKSVLYVSEGWRAGAVMRGSLLDDALTSANRHNVALYPLDPRGLDAGGRGVMANANNVLHQLAEETGGRIMVSRNAFEESLADMVRDASAYYLLGYTSRAGNDGKFHEITVRLKRKGLDVRARKGYWAMSAEDALRAAAPPTPAIDRSIVETLGSIERGATRPGYGKTWVGTSRGDAGRTRVIVVWETPGATGQDRAVATGRVLVSATEASGATLVRGRIAEVVGSSRARSLAFDAAPGMVDLRIDIEGLDGTVLDSERRRLEVPDFTADTATISTPHLFRGRTAREISAARDDASAVPLATREFSRAERLLIRFDVYNGSDRSVPRATLINRRGQRLRALPVAAGAGGTHNIEVGLGFVAIGDYVVEIAADGYREEVTALLAFRIVG